MMDTILRSLCLLPNLRVYWRTTYQIGYDAGRWDGRGKVDDADEKAKVISRWGESGQHCCCPIHMAMICRGSELSERSLARA
jgi:hypothetical protein